MPLHLPSTFTVFAKLTNSRDVRVAMMGDYGLAWPWESLHIEALAWFDHWLKGRDTGILEGPRFRYVIPEEKGWHASETWPLPQAAVATFALREDGGLSADEGATGSRSYMNLGGGLHRPHASEANPPSFLTWDSTPLAEDLAIVGPIELQLDAACTAPDTAFFAFLQDLEFKGRANDCHRRISPGRNASRQRSREQTRRACSRLPDI